MEGFFEKYTKKLLDNSSDAEDGCRVWTKGLKKGGKYGVINTEFPEVGWRVIHAHTLYYMCHHRVYALPPKWDVSHLCHNGRCLRLDHLVLEPHAVNTSRQKCVNRGRCLGHGPYPRCMRVWCKTNINIFVLIRLSSVILWFATINIKVGKSCTFRCAHEVND